MVFWHQENSDDSLYSFIGPSGQPDATETILNYADTNGFRVFLGLYLPNGNHDMTESNFLYDTQAKMAVVAQQAWNRYLSGNPHSSFAGWYIPYEPWTASYQPDEVERLRSFFQAVHASCQVVSGDVPLAIAPFVEVFVTFDFSNYMNPVAFLSTWDQARRAQMQQLFSDYKADFVDADYAPFAPPAISASLAGHSLMLRWGGMLGDQFQVQFKTNLADAAWTPLSSQMFTNGTEFSAVDADLVPQQARYYRVLRFPRLQVPDSMVYIRPGTFLMGTPANDPNQTADELPQFQVTLTRGFWINQFELTQSECQNLACTNPATFTGDLDRPVENISWSNAMEYCALLTQQERQASRLPDDYLYRLPTEAEWEYAARAGTTNWFSFGDDPSLLSAYAWYDGDSQWTTHPVGQLQPNPWGLNDVYGNVFEWCWDWIESAPTQPVTDFRGSTTDLYHAIRGGASSFPWADCRSSWRTGYSPASITSDVGFRIIVAPAP